MNSSSRRTLVLNATYEPLGVVSDRRALILILNNRATMIEESGDHSWENVVSACHRCNHVKADRTLKELGWRLRSLPREPVGAAWRILGTARAEERWVRYLAPFGVVGASA
ncbi:MAG: HNH endonuclease [Actinobacteria bacterium]|nr:HNH endonuclease [Actinomycetota bacterium]